MRDPDDDPLLYLGLGPLAAIVLGAVLVPWREVTVASNFGFLFVALTIVVAEQGGRWAALATALVSALSLDFFLTRPYLRLTIEGKHDVIAFAGLAFCGLVAAALGSEHGRRATALRQARSQLELLSTAARHLEEGIGEGSSVEQVLEAARAVLPVAALVIRDRDGRIVAESPRARRRPSEFEPLPSARVALTSRNHEIGSLDVWSPQGIGDDRSQRTVLSLASLMAAMLAGARR